MEHFLQPTTGAALNRLADLDIDPASAPLERLRALRRLLRELEADPAALASARAALLTGVTWDEIANAAGLKPAAARWRWQGSDEEIAARLDAGRKRSARPSSVPTGLPGRSVADAAAKLGVTAQAVYLQVRRGTLTSETVELPDGRKYKRVFLPDDEVDAAGAAVPDPSVPHPLALSQHNGVTDASGSGV